MALATGIKRAKKERQQLYFDLICGIISSSTAITGIIYVGLTQKITNYFNYITGLSFWIFYLCFSIFMIGLGIFLWHKEKYFDDKKVKKDVRAPIIS
ncbi:MAG: hypothetical protein ACFFE4_10530 [Candidatus Thorarchaeota archaeon]